MVLRQPRRGAFRPLDEHQRSRTHDLVPAKIGQLVRRIESIEIDVKHRRLGCAVFVDESVGRARDLLTDSVAKTNRLRQCGFADAELAGQRYDQRWSDRSTEIYAPVSQLGLGEPEMTSAGERRNQVPMSGHASGRAGLPAILDSPDVPPLP